MQGSLLYKRNEYFTAAETCEKLEKTTYNNKDFCKYNFACMLNGAKRTFCLKQYQIKVARQANNLILHLFGDGFVNFILHNELKRRTTLNYTFNTILVATEAYILYYA